MYTATMNAKSYTNIIPAEADNLKELVATFTQK
jgi:hypothetical protein